MATVSCATGPRQFPLRPYIIGQILYLEAEASGLRGTGIGCFFDDLTHRVFGLTGDRFQVLYHFTVGGPVDDMRLQTHPPYQHLARRGGE